MKRILFFFPLNLMNNNTGSMRRAWKILSYFQKRKFIVDLVYSSDLGGEPMSEEDIRQLKKVSGVRNVFSLRRKPKRGEVFSYLFQYKIGKLVNNKKYEKSIPNFVTPYNKRLFKEILKKNKYDYIIISYLYWADLIKDANLTKGATLIVDTHDFLTSQEQQKKGLSIGTAFEDEINRLRLFDEIWVVSTDEQYLFRQFCDRDIQLVPIAFDVEKKQSSENTSFDLIYVASDNPHNIRAAKWFFDEVFPNIGMVTLCVIGKIVNHVPEHPNVLKIGFVEELGSYYRRSRIAICPMLSGTGVKIKVLEALSYGLPVVCSPRGVDGLVSKVNNGCYIGDTSKGFAEGVLKLLSSQEEYKDLADKAVSFMAANYSEQRFENILDLVFLQE